MGKYSKNPQGTRTGNTQLNVGHALCEDGKKNARRKGKSSGHSDAKMLLS